MYHLTYGQTERQRERQRDRETERQRDRETERQRDRDRQTYMHIFLLDVYTYTNAYSCQQVNG